MIYCSSLTSILYMLDRFNSLFSGTNGGVVAPPSSGDVIRAYVVSGL